MRPRALPPLAWLLGLACALSTPAFAREWVVVVDPGHGGAQEGAVGARGLYEKHLALALAKKLKARLGKAGVKVVLTREQDVDLPLAERVKRANAHKPDLFLSIHANSMPTQRQRLSTEGVETYFLSAHASGEDARKVAARENADAPGMAHGGRGDTLAFILADLQRSSTHAESSRLAYAVHQKLVERSGAVDRGVHQAPFYVLMGVEAPAVLVEVGFISHPTEGRRLADELYQEALATALAEGVQGFFSRARANEGTAKR